MIYRSIVYRLWRPLTGPPLHVQVPRAQPVRTCAGQPRRALLAPGAPPNPGARVRLAVRGAVSNLLLAPGAPPNPGVRVR